MNRGRSRCIPEDREIRVHRSVKTRMEAEELKYQPKAKWRKEPIWVD